MPPIPQMMGPLARVFGGELRIPPVLVSTVQELPPELNPDGLTRALESLGHIAVRQNPEVLANALRAGDVFSRRAAQSLAETPAVVRRPYPWPVRIPFDLPNPEIHAYTNPKKSRQKHARDRDDFLDKFSDHVREIDTRMEFPSNDLFHGLMLKLTSTLWALGGVENHSMGRRFQSLHDAYAAYAGGSVADPRQWRTPISGKETLRDFYLYRFSGMAVNEMVYANAGLPVLNPLSDQPPAYMAPSPFADFRGHLFSLFYDQVTVRETLRKTGVSRYRFQTGGHDLTERMLSDHFDPVPSKAPLRINDVVVFPGSPDYFHERGLLYGGRVVFAEDGETWIEGRWGVFSAPLIHPLEMAHPAYGFEIFAARPKSHLTAEPARETIDEAGFRIPSSAPDPQDVLRAATRLASELPAKGLDWIHENF